MHPSVMPAKGGRTTSSAIQDSRRRGNAFAPSKYAPHSPEIELPWRSQFTTLATQGTHLHLKCTTLAGTLSFLLWRKCSTNQFQVKPASKCFLPPARNPPQQKEGTPRTTPYQIVCRPGAVCKGSQNPRCCPSKATLQAELPQKTLPPLSHEKH